MRVIITNSHQIEINAELALSLAICRELTKKIQNQPFVKKSKVSLKVTTTDNRFQLHSFFKYLAKEPYEKQVLSRAHALCFEQLALRTNRRYKKKTPNVHIRGTIEQVLVALRRGAELDHSERDSTLSQFLSSAAISTFYSSRSLEQQHS